MMMTFGANRCLTIKTKKEMKKNLFMVAAVALMALVSCNKEEINGGVVETPQPQEPSVIVEFTASLDAEDTKTTLDATNQKTLWSADDAISINGQKFTIKEIQEDGKAVFVNVAELPADFGAPFTAIYPYGSDGKVPAAQDAVADNFDPKAVIETATSENHSLSFKNVTSLLKFQVPAACKSVSVASDDVLAGDSDKVVTISGDFVAGKDYYVAVLPGTKKNFVVRIDGYLSKNAASVTINRSTIANMKTLPAATKSAWGLVGLNGDWNNDLVLYNDLDGYFVAKNVEIKSTDEFKFRKDKAWTTTISGGITAPDTKRDGGWVNMTISKAGTYDVYTNGTNYYIMTPGKLPAEASAPGPIEITVTFDGDTNRDYIHIWSDGGEIANNKACSSKNPFTWKVTVPVGDQQKRDYQFILKKGSGWGSYQTSDSDKLCLRNPMPLKIVNNKVTHK